MGKKDKIKTVKTSYKAGFRYGQTELPKDTRKFYQQNDKELPF